jgi:hypothetical protein
MIIIYIIIGILVILGIYILFIHQCQKKKDQRFIDHLRSQEGTLILSVPFTHERFSSDGNELFDLRTSENHNVMVGNGFMVITEPIVAFYNKDMLKDGVDRITWSIDINQAKIVEKDSLEIKCILPDDESTYSLFTFSSNPTGGNREKVVNKLGLR